MKSTRPDVPKSYGLREAAGPDDLLPWEWTEARLVDARNYWVVTSDGDGQPHAMPVWGIWLAGGLLFSTARRSRKALNLSGNPKIVIHLESGDEVVVIEGEAREVADRSVLREYVDAYQAKYALKPDVDQAGTVNFEVRPRTVFGWSEADYPNTATRWEFAV